MSDPDYLKCWLPFSKMEEETPENRENLVYLVLTGERIVKITGGEVWRSGYLQIQWERNDLRVMLFFKDQWILGADWISPKFYYQAEDDEVIAEAVKEFKKVLILEELADV